MLSLFPPMASGTCKNHGMSGNGRREIVFIEHLMSVSLLGAFI